MAGTAVPAHRPHAMRTGPPENTRPPRPRPFGPQPSRTHSCSLTRNGCRSRLLRWVRAGGPPACGGERSDPGRGRAMSDEVAAPSRRPALSPSRESDFKQCPLLYRFRAIDRLPEPSSTAQVRGSVVHAALEQLYALPAASRGPETAMTLVDPAWERVTTERPEIAL